MKAPSASPTIPGAPVRRASSPTPRAPVALLAAILLGLLASSSAEARQPAAEEGSAGALQALRAALDAGRSWDEVLAAPFARQGLGRADAAAAHDAIVAAWRARLVEERRAELERGELRDGDLVMPFFAKAFGTKPDGGHALWISLHGGGGAPARVNDSQWENQKRLYAPEEGIYVAPRAPTNTWNLWHEAHVDRMFHRLIENLVIVGDVDPDRVYVLGYSAGGDGVYQLAPRMADHWAAAAMMAGHPNGVSLEPVRNVPFALQVGALDAAYDRNRIAGEYGKALEAFRAADAGGYRSLVRIHEGKGHWMDREDAAALPWMAAFHRDPVPERIVWIPSAASRRSSYWLALPEGAPASPGRIAVRREGQSIVVEDAGEADTILVRLDDRSLDPDAPVRVVASGRVLHEGPVPRTIHSLVRTLLDRGDPELAFPCEIEVRTGARPVSAP